MTLEPFSMFALFDATQQETISRDHNFLLLLLCSTKIRLWMQPTELCRAFFFFVVCFCFYVCHCDPLSPSEENKAFAVKSVSGASFFSCT